MILILFYAEGYSAVTAEEMGYGI